MPAEDGYVPTPAPLADYVAASALFEPPDPDDRVLYPGAGTGNLLAAVHRRCAVRHLPAPDGVAVEHDSARATRLRDRVVGPDAACNHGIPRLPDGSKCYHTPISWGPHADHRSDPQAVTATLTIQEPDFLRDPPAGPFEYIIANPPYIRYNELSTEDRDYYREQFETATGQFNLYAPFIEQMLEVLAPDGILAFLAPVSYLTTWAAEPLRNRLRYATPYTSELLPEFVFPDRQVTVTLTVVVGPDHRDAANRPPSRTQLYLTGLGRAFGTLADRYDIETPSDRASTPRERLRDYQRRVRFVTSDDTPGRVEGESVPGVQRGLDTWS
jgi:SAM-dependent methyltransferase